MRLIEVPWRPTEKQLRQFGWLCLIMLPLLAWLFLGRPILAGWSPRALTSVISMGAVGALLAVLGQCRPAWLRPIFVGACLVALPIGLVVSEILFVCIYLFVFTPMALIFRVIGRDALQRKFAPQQATYWQPKEQPGDLGRYYRQF